MHHELHTEIDIDATPEQVWQVLTGLDRYAEWNPFIVSSVGKIVVGEKLINELRSPGGRVMTFKPTVTVVEPVKVFEWLGHLGLPGIFDGRHRFELHLLPDGGTRLVHGERVKGVLVRVLRRSLDTETKQRFREMNVALKARAEGLAADHDHHAGHDLGIPQRHASEQGSTPCF